MTGAAVVVRRGDIVTVAASGYASKPRPALIVQAEPFTETHASMTVCLLSSTLEDAPLFRISETPSPHNGLREPSQIMVDKLVSVPRRTLGERLGRLDPTTLGAVDEALRLWLGG